MRLLVLIPGFGDPHWDAKVDILRKNIATVAAYFDDYTFKIIQYTADKTLPADILENPRIDVVHDKGVLGRNLCVHATPAYVETQAADYVVLLLDDVELQAPFDWQELISLKSVLSLDIISPVLPSPRMTPWNFMVQNTDWVAAEMTRCELFCYLMTPETYKRYYEYLDINNPWMWGMDFMLSSHMKLRVGVAHRIRMIHYFSRATYDPGNDPRVDAEAYLKKHNTSWDELHAIPSILRLIQLGPTP